MKKFLKIVVVGFLIIAVAIIIEIIYWINKPSYTAEDFGIEVIKSKTDKDGDGIDDYTDILLGARAEAERKPEYKSAYYAGGYPPETEGVCTDVIWRALRDAGYSLKDMVDEDIARNVEAYPRVGGKPDSNIDFRRVPNLKVYFERNHITLTNDLSKIAEWQPSDIVVFGNTHVGIISNKRNKNGVPYLIHNGGQPNREEDILELYNKYEPISGHYRIREIWDRFLNFPIVISGKQKN